MDELEQQAIQDIRNDLHFNAQEIGQYFGREGLGYTLIIIAEGSLIYNISKEAVKT